MIKHFIKPERKVISWEITQRNLEIARITAKGLNPTSIKRAGQTRTCDNCHHTRCSKAEPGREACAEWGSE